MSNHIQLVDCPRDAIQGINIIIPTWKKAVYIQQLIDSDLFEFIDFGSFVSPKAVPQMQDTAEVIEMLEKRKGTKLIAIIANEKGAELGAVHQQIDYLGYPFSISETFQKRNTNSSLQEAYETVMKVKNMLIRKGNQELMIYLSMAFGNPYGDVWSTDIIVEWMDRLTNLGISKFSIADTTAEASPQQIRDIFSLIRHFFPDIELSIHLHSRLESAVLKIDAAYEAGCTIFEGAIMGYGGCPFAKDDLVGNIPTEILLNRFSSRAKYNVQDLLNGFQQLISNNEV